jgi:ABC toxin N-terminal region/Neuraminidase-like domain/Salmonella virulence plasmid 28.1kDa A protein
MANCTIKGRLVSESTREPAPGLQVEAIAAAAGDKPIGTTTADAAGAFAITLSPAVCKKLVATGGEAFFRVYRDRQLVLETKDGESWSPRTGELPVLLAIPDESSGNGSADVFVASGRVTTDADVAVPNARIEVWDRNVDGSTLLGTTSTDAEGKYSVLYDPSLLRGKSLADLEIRVVDPRPDGGELARSRVVYQAARSNVTDLTVAGTVVPRPPEYLRLVSGLQPLLRDKQITTLDADGVTYLAERSGWDARSVAMAAQAAQMETETQIPAEHYYALLRAGLPSDPRQLHLIQDDQLVSILEQAIASGVIADDHPIDETVRLHQEEATKVLRTAVAGGAVSSLGDMLALRLDDAQQAKFLEVYRGTRADPDALWSQLGAAGLDPAMIAGLQTDAALGNLTLQNAPVVGRLIKDAGIEEPSDLAANGFYESDAWLKVIGQNVPQSLTAETYAAGLAAQVRLSYPTATVADLVRRKTLPVDGDGATSAEIATFLASADGQHTIGVEPVRTWTGFDQLSDPGRAGVKQIERLYQMSPSNEAMAALSQLKLDSAFGVARYDREAFVSTFGKSFPSEAEARRVHQKALDIHSATLNLATMYLAYRSNPAVYPLAGAHSEPLAAAPNTGTATATLESLFENTDYCSCDECKSVLGPSAYLVELLEFIDASDVVHTKSNPVDVLLGRRPDLQHILLSCENTNVALPYIDLVNEVLEFYIAHGSLATFTGYNMRPDSVSADLLADPQYVQDSAYDETLKEVFPPPLPFDVSVEAMRLQFQAWSTTLSDVLHTFGDEAGARREKLELNAAEYSILTDLTFRKLPEYFGEPAGATIDELNAGVANAKTFARRVGLTYEELVELLTTNFINPGYALVVDLEALHADLKDLEAWYEGAKTDAELNALLPSNLDTTPYGGDVLTWLKDNRELIMGLVTLTAVSDAPPDCDMAAFELRFALPDPTKNQLTPIAYHKLLRFNRLWRKLGWTIDLTDRAITTFLGMPAATLSQANIDAAFESLLARLANFRRLLDGLSVAAQQIPDWLDLWDTTIDAAVRRERLARLLRAGTIDLADLAEITGHDPLADDMDADEPALLQLVAAWKAVKASPMKVSDLDYLLRHKDVTGKLTPTEEGLLRDLRTLRDGLTAVDADLSTAITPPDLGSARAKMALVYDPTVVDRFFGLVNATTTYSASFDTAEEALPKPITDVSSAIGLDAFNKALTFVGVMPATTKTALDTAADGLALADMSEITTQPELNDFIAKLKSAVQALSTAGDADVQALGVDYPELKTVYDSLAGVADPNARAALIMSGILPALRDGLKTRALQTALGNLLHTDGTVVDVLTSGAAVLHANSAPLSGILTDFRALEQPVDLGSNGAHQLLLDPPATDAYFLYVDAPQGTKVTLTAAADDLIPTTTADASGEVRTSAAVALEAGQLFAATLTLADLPAGKSATISWRTKAMAKTAVPSSRIYGQANIAEARASLMRLQKAGALQRLLSLSPSELDHLASTEPATSGVLNNLDTDGSIDAASLHALWAKVAWLLWFAALASAVGADPDTIVAALEDPAAKTPQGDTAIGRLMDWDETDLADVLTHLGLTAGDLSQLSNLRSARELLDIVATTMQPAFELIACAVSDPTPAIVADVEAKVKARMDVAAWREAVTSMNDMLRNRRRDALVAYILAHRPPAAGVDTPDKLYEHFLIDAEMDACMQTSRIRLALSTVQLFITRCLMNLEPDVAPSSIRADRWEWMKRYRVWEANRKVFLYPENWLEPELRDGKSPFFRDLESELLKADITDEAAEDAYLAYLKKLDDVARLEVVGAFLQERQPGKPDDDVLHVFGRTMGATREHWYRRFEAGYWTPWEKVSLNLQGDLLLPVIWKSQLFVFWVSVAEKPDRSDSTQTPVDVSKTAWGGNATVTAEVTLNWGEYYNGKWVSPKSSDLTSPLRIPNLERFEPKHLVLAARTFTPDPNVSERLMILVFYLDKGLKYFAVTFTSKNSRPSVAEALTDPVFSEVDLFNYKLFFGPPIAKELESNGVTFDGKTMELAIEQPAAASVSSRDEIVLTKTNLMLDGFRVRPLMHPVENQWEAPIFYSDEHSVFFLSAKESIREVLGGYYVDVFSELEDVDIKNIPNIYETPVKPKPGDPVMSPFVDVIDENFKTVIVSDAPFEYAGVTFDARGRVGSGALQ